jgi:hypothetical protein
VPQFNSGLVRKKLDEYFKFSTSNPFLEKRNDELRDKFGDIAQSVYNASISLLQATFFLKILPTICNELDSLQNSHPSLKKQFQQLADYCKSLQVSYQPKNITLEIFETLFLNYTHSPSVKLIEYIDGRMRQFFAALPYYKETLELFTNQLPIANIFTDSAAAIRKHGLIAIISIIEKYNPIIKSIQYCQKYAPLEVI